MSHQHKHDAREEAVRVVTCGEKKCKCEGSYLGDKEVREKIDFIFVYGLGKQFWTGGALMIMIDLPNSKNIFFCYDISIET